MVFEAAAPPPMGLGRRKRRPSDYPPGGALEAAVHISGVRGAPLCEMPH